MDANGMYLGHNNVRIAAEEAAGGDTKKGGGLKASLDQITPLDKVVKGLTAAGDALEGTAWQELRDGIARLLDMTLAEQEKVLEQTRADLQSRRQQGQSFVPTPGMISGKEAIPEGAASQGQTVAQAPEKTRI